MRIIAKQTIQKSPIEPQQVIKLLLKNRRIVQMTEFLHPPLPQSYGLVDFGYQKVFQTIIDDLKRLRRENKRIVIYTDYDADGITGGAILWETLHLLGFKVMPYVPHRQLEGYGFSKQGIDSIKTKYNPSLIVSVDHGITAANQIAYASSLGMEVIVTDHHLKQKEIPNAAKAIFHIPQLSGAGVAYYFAKEIFNTFSEINSSATEVLRRYFETDYIVLSTIGTVADLVPLIGPARSLVKEGLMLFPRVERHGIKQLCQQAGLADRPLTPFEIGFILAPRLNAVGRLEHALDALRLLCTTNQTRARLLAQRMGLKNSERQDIVKRNVEEAVALVENKKKNGQLPKLLVLYSPFWHEGVLGLIASALVEKYYRPTLVITGKGNMLKGSARSIPSFPIVDFLVLFKSYLASVGGHKQAAGFSLENKVIVKFQQEVENQAEKLIKEEQLERVCEVDIYFPLSAVTLDLARRLESLAPFGVGNPAPTFASDVIVEEARIFGRDSSHLRLLVKGNENKRLELVAFGRSDIFTSLYRGQKVQVAYQLEINRWNNNEALQGKLLEINF